jgi:hypothetical protein
MCGLFRTLTEREHRYKHVQTPLGFGNSHEEKHQNKGNVLSAYERVPSHFTTGRNCTANRHSVQYVSSRSMSQYCINIKSLNWLSIFFL